MPVTKNVKLEGSNNEEKCRYEFIDAFDCFFKIHKVFDISYHPLLKNLLIFIDRFIFMNLEASGVTNKMHEIAANISTTGL